MVTFACPPSGGASQSHHGSEHGVHATRLWDSQKCSEMNIFWCWYATSEKIWPTTALSILTVIPNMAASAVRVVSIAFRSTCPLPRVAGLMQCAYYCTLQCTAVKSTACRGLNCSGQPSVIWSAMHIWRTPANRPRLENKIYPCSQTLFVPTTECNQINLNETKYFFCDPSGRKEWIYLRAMAHVGWAWLKLSPLSWIMQGRAHRGYSCTGIWERGRVNIQKVNISHVNTNMYSNRAALWKLMNVQGR